MQWPRVLNSGLEEVDPELYDIIEHEKNRQYKVGGGTAAVGAGGWSCSEPAVGGLSLPAVAGLSSASL